MGEGSNHSMWGHLPLLVRASSKESVEYILQALWRTRRTGLDAADRQMFRDILRLPNDSDLDPVSNFSSHFVKLFALPFLLGSVIIMLVSVLKAVNYGFTDYGVV